MIEEFTRVEDIESRSVGLPYQRPCSSLFFPDQMVTYTKIGGKRDVTQVITTTAGPGEKAMAYPINGFNFGPRSAALENPLLFTITSGITTVVMAIPTVIELVVTTFTRSSSTNTTPSSIAQATGPFAAAPIFPGSRDFSRKQATWLSTAAAIGIGSAAVIGLLSIAILLAFCFLRRRKRRRAKIPTEKESLEHQDCGEELPGSSPRLQEELCEMSAKAEARELCSKTSPLELPGWTSQPAQVFEMDQGQDTTRENTESR